MSPLKPVTPDAGDTYVKITEPKTRTLQIRAEENTKLRLAVCGTCGYTEYYVEDAARLWKYWQKGYR